MLHGVHMQNMVVVCYSSRAVLYINDTTKSILKHSKTAKHFYEIHKNFDAKWFAKCLAK